MGEDKAESKERDEGEGANDELVGASRYEQSASGSLKEAAAVEMRTIPL